MATFLLDEHLGRRDIAVDKAGVAEFDLPFEGNEVADVLNDEDIGEQVEPELLAFAFLVAAVGPVGLELQSCAILLGFVHGVILNYEFRTIWNFLIVGYFFDIFLPFNLSPPQYQRWKPAA